MAVTSTVALRLIASLRASATVELMSIEAFLTLCDCRNGRIEGMAIISSTAKMARVTSISISVKPRLRDVRMAHFQQFVAPVLAILLPSPLSVSVAQPVSRTWLFFGVAVMV